MAPGYYVTAAAAAMTAMVGMAVMMVRGDNGNGDVHNDAYDVTDKLMNC